MTVTDRKHYVQTLFGEWVSYEGYLRRYARRLPLKQRLDEMTLEQTMLLFLTLSRCEIDKVVLSLPFCGTYAEEDRYEKLSDALDRLGDPPPEATIRRREPDPVTSRFCRVRHQRHYSCPMCDYVCRLAVRWSPEAGIIYPAQPSCPKCKSWVGMVKFRETYLPKMPPPYSYDPEPERSTAWRSL